jgi:hypothetical protein
MPGSLQNIRGEGWNFLPLSCVIGGFGLTMAADDLLAIHQLDRMEQYVLLLPCGRI